MRIKDKLGLTVFMLIVILTVIVLICKGAVKSAWEKI